MNRKTLSRENEQRIGRRIKLGDQEAVNALVVANLSLAGFMANRYRRAGIDLDDLMQEATIGLILAARRFDPDRGVRFATYAAWWVENQVRRYIRSRGASIRVGDRMDLTIVRLRRAEERLLQKHAGVTLKMIAEEAGVDLDLADVAWSPATGAPLSLDRVLGETGSEFTLMETLADSGSLREFSQAEFDAILSPLIDRLPPRQRQVIQLRFFENQSANEIGKVLGISGSRVKQIELQAVRSLRKEVMLRHGSSFRTSREAA